MRIIAHVRIETLQSLSVGIVFFGLLLVAVGGFGAFHFGHRLEREAEEHRNATIQSLTEIVSNLQEEQRNLRERVAAAEGKTGGESLPEIAAGPSASPAPSAASTSAVTLATGSAPAMPDLLLPHPLASAGTPSATEPESPAIQPPKLYLAPKNAPPAATLAMASAPPVTLAPTPPPAAHDLPSAPPAESTVQPPKLPLSPQPSPLPATVTPEEQDSITGEKRTRLVGQLRHHSGWEITIRAAAENPQAVKMAHALKSVFREADWSVGEIETTSHRLAAGTLTLSTGSFPPSKAFVAAYGGLARAGYLVTSDLAASPNKQRITLSVGPMH